MFKNRWIILIAALSAQMAIGSFYAWSLFNTPLIEAFGWNEDNVVLIYSFSLIMFAASTIISGKMQIKKGPRFTAIVGGILFSSGILLSGLVTSPLLEGSFIQNTPYILYITYGVLAGTGVGFIYVCPLATLVKWFPNNKGVLTGVATAGFAIGAYVFKDIIGTMFNIGDAAYTAELVSKVFLTVGSIYTVMTIGGAMLLAVPEGTDLTARKYTFEGRSYTRSEMLKTKNFYKLLASDFFALMPGLLIIGLAKNIGTDYVHLDYTLAAGIVGWLALINAGGRLVSGILADRFGALKVYRVMYVITILSLAILAFVPMSYTTFFVAIAGIAISYGAFLSLVPTIVGKLYGPNNFSANYSLIFQAYGVAALVGPQIKRATSGDYNLTFLIAMSTAIIGLVFAMLINQKEQQVEG